MIFNLEAGEVKTLPIASNMYPEDITVKAGENAVFSAVIDKDGIPTEYKYEWYVNNSLVSGETSSVYTRKTGSDNGVYTVYCEITNKAGTVKTRTAKLTVNALPKLDSAKPANVSCYVGDSKTFEVAIATHGYPKQYTYQWYKNGSKISGATSPTYSFAPTDVGTTTLYCEVTNSAGTVKSRTATVTCTRYYLVRDGEVKVAKSYSGLTVATSGGVLQLKQAETVSGEVCYANFGPIDLTKYKTLTTVITSQDLNNSEYNNRFGVAKSKNSESFAASVTPTVATKSVDVSSLSGSYYIVFTIYKTHVSGAYRYINTSNIWFE
jgi:hypothetical protein